MGYFVVASLFKVPLPILGLFCISLIDLLKSLRKQIPREEIIFLLVPALCFAIYFNFFFRAQIGIRFFLVAFPILLIFSVRILQKWECFQNRTRIIYILSGFYLIASVASYFPHHLSYFNELILNRRNAYLILADSNLDWGQNSTLIEEILDEHPEYIFEPITPTAGLIVVSANKLTGVLGGPERYAWLRENFKPVGHIYYTHFIFDISPSDLKRILD